ncbi:hypothetical protein ACFSUS_14325 [Spirosoma soli]|uniref:Uncharacterized protein n=1 Tax=Spirosoma soli TaxID=1770529 RepID=A0ABW5M5I6_9BACT
MTIELYAASTSDALETIDSPISNTTGELPDQEPTLDLGDLLGTFDSREEAINFVQNRASVRNQEVVDTHYAPFNVYTHVDWLKVTLKNADQSTQHEHYYLVTDEGY